MEEQSGQFPSFSQFVKFLIREVKIACNPVTSLQALKQGETEKPKQQRQQNVKAKTLTTTSNEETTRLSLSCEVTEHFEGVSVTALVRVDPVFTWAGRQERAKVKRIWSSSPY
uniref:Uncharacterized protein n=1 Tax=Cynoglossus semilaevis TaxID=244447 RepID=A0A3P8URG7_CYNSE